MQHNKKSEEYDKLVRDYGKLNQTNEGHVKDFRNYQNMCQRERNTTFQLKQKINEQKNEENRNRSKHKEGRCKQQRSYEVTKK